MTVPNDRNEKIWRYMDFVKFILIMDKKALFLHEVIGSKILLKECTLFIMLKKEKT